MKKKDGIAYLMRNGNLRVPDSRYGIDTEECAQIAWRCAYLYNREGGFDNGLTPDNLDYMMSLVVNDHEDVAHIVRSYGWGHYTT